MRMKLWQTADNYLGTDYSEYYVLSTWNFTQWDNMGQSNHEYIKAVFDGENLPLEVVNMSSWAGGAFEIILVHKDNEKAVELASDLYDQMQSYPLLNEDRYYELRRLQADDLWTYANKKEICKKVGFKLSEYIEEPECPEEVFEYYDENGWLD
jgi:hypothetical protein